MKLDLARALSSGAPELEGRRPLSDAVVQAAARRILATRPGAFGPVSDPPSLARSIVAAPRDLAEVPSGALDRLAARSPLASELVSIHRALASDLVAGFHDERERADLASRRVGSGDAQRHTSCGTESGPCPPQPPSERLDGRHEPIHRHALGHALEGFVEERPVRNPG